MESSINLPANKRLRSASIDSSETPPPEQESLPTPPPNVSETPREHVQDQYDVETPRYSGSATSAAAAAAAASTVATASSTPKPSSQPTTKPLTNYRQYKAPEFAKWEVPATDYTLVRLLGSGSYGDVAEAIDLRTKQTVAIKRIHNVFDQPTDTKRILREVNILRQLSDVRLVKLLNILMPRDLSQFNEIYLVFEYMKTDLAKLISGPQYLRIQHIQFLMYQLLGALKYMHSRSVVHRDLKPANILINDDCTLKICDFGLARFLAARPGAAAAGDSRPSSPVPATAAVAVVGMEAPITPSTTNAMESVTPLRTAPLQRQLTKHVVTRWYRSPEIILYQQYSTPVDVWSAGCIFAELLSMQKTSVANYQDRVPLFPGKTCFPLSCDNDRTYKDQLDQLNVIFDLIGTPTAEDIVNLTEVGGYLRALPKKPAKDLQAKFPGAPREAIDLLKQMFAFNPNKRITVDRALEHPFFASIRTPDKEHTALGPISSIENLKLDAGALRARLIEEIRFYHPTTM